MSKKIGTRLYTRNIVFDLNGTLIRNGKILDSVSSEKIIHLRKTNAITFASARPIRDILPLLPKELQDCHIIGCNEELSEYHD